MLKAKKLKNCKKALSRAIIVILMVAIAVATSIATYAVTASNLNSNQQTNNTIPTYQAQGNLVIRVQNPTQQQVHLQQNESIYVNNVPKSILKCDGQDTPLAQLIGLGVNQTVELIVDYQPQPNEQLSIKAITVEGGDLVTFTQQTNIITPISRQTSVPKASIVFTSGDGGAILPSGTLSGMPVGSMYPLQAYPNTGYIFSSWTYTGPIYIYDVSSASTAMVVTGAGGGSITGNFIRASDPRIAISSGASQSIFAEITSSPIVIQRLDSQNRPITTGTATVNLASTSSGNFFLDSAGKNQVTSITIANGTSTAVIWYKDSTPGLSTLTASSSGYSPVSTTFTIKALSGLSVWDQTGDTAPWAITKSGAGNSGSLTVTSPGYNDTYAAHLTCTAFPDTQGAIAQQYWFDTLTVGQTYTCTFYYKSDVDFTAYFFSATSTWANVYTTSLSCDASASWKAASFEIGPIQPATYYWLSFNLYSAGQVQTDNVCFGPTA